MVETTIALNKARSFVKECNEAGLFFNKVYLFGSFAKGNAHEWSDVDLLLVSDQFTRNTFENIKLYLKINARYPEVETHTYPTDYFLKGDSFIEDILKTSIEVST